MFAFPTNLTEVFITLHSLKNKKFVGIDGVSAELRKTSFPVNIFILGEFLSVALSRGWRLVLEVAKQFKSICFTEIGDVLSINNYRSISILPAFSQEFEKIMFERICSFFDKKNLFYSKQIGFRSERSNIDALVEYIDQIRQRSTDTFTCNLLDLRKAFDSINHENLLAQMEKYGVRRIC